jgi:small subunit ribosomal protein S6
MNLYETVYVVRQDIRPEDLKPIEEKFENLLRLKKSSIEYKENWGLRSLAYKISNNKKGYYYFLVHNSDPEAIIELERNFKINEDVIRFLTTKASKVPTEPTPIMKAKIDKENSERAVPEIDLKEKEAN